MGEQMKTACEGIGRHHPSCVLERFQHGTDTVRSMWDIQETPRIGTGNVEHPWQPVRSIHDANHR
jgi:hypothetical protein